MASDNVIKQNLKFTLKVGSLEPDTFRVHEFTMQEAMSACFRLHIQAACLEGNLEYSKMIGADATLAIIGEDFTVTHHGMVTTYNQFPNASESFGVNSFIYDISIEPHLKLLSYSSQNRIFQKMTLKDIINKVLTEDGLKSGVDFDFNLKGTYSNREYTVQYNETNLDFIARLMEHEGIFYFFNHADGKDKLIMADQVSAVLPILKMEKVELESESGLSHKSVDHLTKLCRIQKMVSGKVTLKDYNDRTPSVNILGSASKPGKGGHNSFGSNILTTSQAEHLANIRAEMQACRMLVLEGEGLCRDFRTGHRFEFVDAHDATFFKGKYTILRVTHNGDQREGFEGDGGKISYSNNFTCIPADVIFRPELNTKQPKIHGVITAKVDGPEGKYAFLDEEGRYHAKLPFDVSSAKDGQASLPIRMTQPYGGPNYGMHFPIHAGNDLVISFIDGDVDRPIALGTSPNPSNGSPVKKGNNSESVIRTASGHQIKLDDKDGKTVIEITTQGKHVLSMNDDPDTKQIHLKTTDGNEIVFDDKNKNIRVCTPEGAHTLKMDYDKKVFTVETKYGHKLTMDDGAKVVAVQTKEGHILMLDDAKKLLALQDGAGKHCFQIDADGSKVSITTEGDLEFSAKGKLDITAKEINMEAKDGAFNAKAKMDFVLEAMNVSAKGKQKVTVEAGLDAGFKGLNLKLEGKVNVESKAGVQNKMSGVMTNVESSAINTIKGAMVMIN